ncbi:MAG: hypothetical protein IIY21_00850 [Clostridiales bacterium]|nr:hypothetical protein [Clostridiales bacterium]MBQ1571439.1 hypothetical protein [Clostridiales bacterium]
MLGITFGTKHSFNDWGVILENTHITPPQPKRYIVSVAGRNGVLDLTQELTPSMRFESRTLTFTFRVKAGDWSTLMAQIYGDVHGRTMDIISDLDPSWHWHGFVTVDDFSSDERTGTLSIAVDADPFKLSNTVSTYSRSGSGTLTCVCDRMEVCPTFTVTAETTVVFGDVTAVISAGTHKIENIEFSEGSNEVTITSTGSTTITYTNGRL